MAELFDCNNTKLSQGSKGEKVTLLQKHLKSLGYYLTYNGRRLVVDGSYGTYTAWAVRQFQKANGLTQDGYFGPKTCQALNAKLNKTTTATATVTDSTKFDCPNINLSRGSSGELVKKLQTLLKQLGYYSDVISGNFLDNTDAAVKAFQRATNHTPDGVFGPKTCKSMNELITSSANAAKSAANTVATAQAVKKDPYLVDKTKNQFKDVDANLNIDGLNFVISSVTFTEPSNAGSWKRVDLMNGGQYVYKSYPVPKQYSVDCYMTKKEYGILENEFYKMMHRVCQVTSTIIKSGRYTVEVSLAYQNVNYRKVTLALIEYLG